ncbi:MAG: prepilin-type N-terminal cleavage/methylation domain-containing protein [Rhodopirellula sp.]|nr:prepilin-type N-terminal cleavage/methylation domain-containing protein [Rhodopirellula sp.]
MSAINRVSRHRVTPSRPAARGFTLIEMLISVALVLLMMLLFAEIFGLASESITLQRALAHNDQQVRSFTTIVREDLKKRTFRTATPFDPTEEEQFQSIPFADRDGYIYISLNDPDNSTDNVLQFTVQSSILKQSGDDSEYYGRATGLVQNDPFVPVAKAQTHLYQNTRQPEHDDGETQINSTGTSSAAEVAYYVRGSRLYRRVSLLRDHVSGQSGVQPRMSWDTVGDQRLTTPLEYLRQNVNPTTTPVVQTTAAGEYRKLDAAAGGTSYSDNYWEDFDFSAVQASFFNGTSFVPDGAELIGASALQNSTSPPSLTRRQIGDPRFRFGFDQFTGVSREFSHADPAAAGFFFLGRYTLEEMSHGNFNFPQNSSSLGGSPFSYIAVPALTDGGVEPDGVVDEFFGGSRRGEDLLLTNVHAFDIEVWDDRIGDFLPIGHSRTASGPDGIFGNADDIPGDYHFLRHRTTTTGISIVPGNSGNWSAATPTWMNRTFDTWHPAYDADGDSEDSDGSGSLDGDVIPGNGTWTEDVNDNGIFDHNYDPAPYRPLTLYPPGSTYGPVPNQGNWAPDTSYNVGDIVFPKDYRPQDHAFIYRCTRAGLSFSFDEDQNGDGILNGNTIPGDGIFTEDLNDNGMLEDSEPAWQTIDGSIIEGRSEDENRDGVLSGDTTAGNGIFTEDKNDNGTLDVEPQWIAISNVRPIRAVRLRVRFLHIASGEMRQLSLVFSLTEN